MGSVEGKFLGVFSAVAWTDAENQAEIYKGSFQGWSTAETLYLAEG